MMLNDYNNLIEEKSIGQFGMAPMPLSKNCTGSGGLLGHFNSNNKSIRLSMKSQGSINKYR